MNEVEKIAVFTTCDDNYILPALVTFESIRRFHPNFTFYIFGCFDEFEKHKDITSFFGIKLIEFTEDYPFKDTFHISRSLPLWPKTCFGHFQAYQYLLKENHTFSLYVDADILCCKPIEHSYIFAPALGISGVLKKDMCINSGVLFFNNAYLNEINFLRIAKDYYNNKKICSHSQCHGYCSELSDQELLDLIIREGIVSEEWCYFLR